MSPGPASPRWRPAPTPPEAAALEAAGHPSWLAALLARRGIRSAEEAEAFLAPSLEHLHDPRLLSGLTEAVERLERAAEEGTRVAVVGDYDVDGISASAILAAVFRACGLEVEVFLPHRLREGYGFQGMHVELAAAAGCGLIVTADCGATSHEAAGAALEAGLGVIVTDHHLTDRELPHGAIQINPRRSLCAYPWPELSGAGLAFKLAGAFAERRGRPVEPTRLLRVACLGTISDVVPLLGENRVIAALGLEALAETRSPGLRALMRSVRVKPPLSAADVGFRLGPRINAAGRMSDPEPALELLLTRDEGRAGRLAEELERRNGERQRAEMRAVEGARRRFDEGTEPPPLLAAWSGEWHRGVVGIAAGRIARQYHRPTLLLSVEGETATGSGRSVPGIPLHAFLSRWEEEYERFGGHAQAVGMTVRTERLPLLAESWQRAAVEWDPELLEPHFEYDARIAAAEIDERLIAELTRLAPFGEGHPRPLFRMGPLEPIGPPRIFGRGHAALRARGADGAVVDLVGWGWKERVGGLSRPFEALGRLERDRYTGRPSLRLLDAHPAA